MDDAEELFELRDHLLNLAGKISEKYGVDSKTVSYTHLTLPTICSV